MTGHRGGIIARRLAPLIGLLAALPWTVGPLTAGARAAAIQASRPDILFDGYRQGILVHELDVFAKGGAMRYVGRTRNLQRDQWGDPLAYAGDSAADKRFTGDLSGTLAGFPALLPGLRAAHLAGLTSFSLPGSPQIYDRQDRIERVVAGKTVAAYRWTARGASNPLDFVIGEDGQLIAAVDPVLDAVFVRRGYEGFTTVAAWRDPSISQPRAGYRVLEQQMAPTRTGEKLATLVYLPNAPAGTRFPTILVRNPYGISELIKRYEQYVVRGYAVVLQAARGTSYWDPVKSEGNLRLMVQEPADSADALKWVTAQGWSDGSICMQGLSYHGYTQWTSAMAHDPALKCVISESTLGTAFGDQPYMGGTFVTGTPFYLFWMHDRKLLPGRTWPEILRHRPLIDMDVFATGKELPAWRAAVTHDRDDDYWQGQNWFKDEKPRDFAALVISGWFDDDFPGSRSVWAMMNRFGTQKNRIIIGPWKHGYNRDRALNGYDFGADAIRDDIWLIKQKWYDHYLKGAKNDVTDRTAEYFEMGSNRWQTATAWPPADARATPLYLGSEGQAARLTDQGRLTAAAPAAAQPADEYVYDPADAPRNWYTFDLMADYQDTQSFPYDFRDIEARGDVLTYTTKPLDQDVTVAGNIKLVLYASASVKDTDWWAYLSDVAPDNSSNRLALGVLRARFRELDDSDYQVFGSNFETEKLLSGNINDVARYEITLRATANLFRKGHRIRVAILNAMDNYSFPNSNMGGAEGLETKTIAGTMRVHHSPLAASQIILPIRIGSVQ